VCAQSAASVRMNSSNAQVRASGSNFLYGRTATLTCGVGNVHGGVGCQGERYLTDDRFSIFGGLGYIPRGDDANLPTGIGGAIGGRLYTTGRKHRSFVEASVAVITAEWWTTAPGEIDQAIRYGPALGIGYQRVGDSGTTFSVSLGAGLAVGARSTRAAHLTGNIALGYTWKRRSSRLAAGAVEQDDAPDKVR
jgi:hypothetical protein